ncbi:macrophage migration inhibitory factor homolog [Fagus crenata]
MPCLYISTNISLDGVDTDPIFSEITKAISTIIGKPENYVMVLLKGSLDIWFGGNKEPAAFGELVSMGGINPEVKKRLIATIGTILQSKLSIPRTRFFLKVVDTTAGPKYSNAIGFVGFSRCWSGFQWILEWVAVVGFGVDCGGVF